MNKNSNFLQEDPFGEKKKIVKGICLRPVTMRHYVTWLEAKPALTIRLSTLPPQFAIMSYMSAIFALEAQAILSGSSVGLLRKFAILLTISMGLPEELCDQTMRFHVSREDVTKLKSVSIFAPETVRETILCGSDCRFQTSREAISTEPGSQPKCKILSTGETATLKDGKHGKVSAFEADVLHVEYEAFPQEATAIFRPFEMNLIREAIADLNGMELPDEAENPELVDALHQMDEISPIKLIPSMENMLDSVAFISGIKTQELADWTILEFERRKKTADRFLRFLICGIGETSGAKWKNGNPYPSWMLEKQEGVYGRFTPISEALSKLGASESWLNSQIQQKSQEQKG